MSTTDQTRPYAERVPGHKCSDCDVQLYTARVTCKQCERAQAKRWNDLIDRIGDEVTA